MTYVPYMQPDGVPNPEKSSFDYKITLAFTDKFTIFETA